MGAQKNLRSPRKRAGALKRLVQMRFPFMRALRDLGACEGRKVLLLGTPLHQNLGDHLLASSEMSFLRGYFKDANVFEVPTDLYLAFKEGILGELDGDDRVFITGGGWMGDLWLRDELTMRDMVKSASSICETIVLPQTVYYASKDTLIFAEARAFWSNASRCLLCVREKASLNTCMHDLAMPRESVALLPDAGLLYQPPKEQHAVLGRSGVVGFCIREDVEASGAFEVVGRLRQHVSESGYNVAELSTMAETPIPYSSREEALQRKLEEFSSVDLVITDRLHGMVFSYLAGTPCIAFDNVTGKVKGVYEMWLSECPSVTVADFEKVQILDVIDAMLAIDVNDDGEELRNRYVRLYEELLGEDKR